MTNALPVVFTAAWSEDPTPTPAAAGKATGAWLAYIGDRVWCADQPWTIAAITYDTTVSASVPVLDLARTERATKSDQEYAVCVRVGDGTLTQYIRETVVVQTQARMAASADQCMAYMPIL
jgi:hypothetical protein